MVSCVSCHGALPAMGNLTGGHVLRLSNEEEGDNLSGCKVTGCHPNAESFDIDGDQTEVEGLLVTLQDQLAAAGILDLNTMLLVKKGKYAQADLAVYWNFVLIESDRSMGVHNYKYTRDVLEVSIAYMSTKGF